MFRLMPIIMMLLVLDPVNARAGIQLQRPPARHSVTNPARSFSVRDTINGVSTLHPPPRLSLFKQNTLVKDGYNNSITPLLHGNIPLHLIRSECLDH